MKTQTVHSGFTLLLSFVLALGITPVLAQDDGSAGSSSSAPNETVLDALIQNALTDEQGVPADIAEFARLADDTAVYKDLTTDDIKNAVTDKVDNLCTKSTGNLSTLDYEECASLVNEIQTIVQREMSIRSLGRDLEATASSFEVPVRDGQGGPVSVNSPVAGILNAWRVHGSGSVAGTGALLRTIVADPDAAKSAAKKINDALSKLADKDFDNTEQQPAAVWRYSMGVRLVRGERKNYPAPKEVGTGKAQPDRQYLFKKWDKLEQPLEDLWGTLKATKFDPPLSDGEVALFTFKDDAMPMNVELWGYVEQPAPVKNADGTTVKPPLDGDVGIRFKIPLDPSFPSLLKEGGGDKSAILGGTYPPEPVLQDSTAQNKKPQDGMMLCSGPLSRRGFLCRTVSDQDGVACAENPAVNDPDIIALTSCTQQLPMQQNETWCCIPPSQSGNNSGAKWDGKNGGTCQVLTKTDCQKQGKPMDDINQCVKYGCDTIVPQVQQITTSGPDVCRNVDWQSGDFDAQYDCKISYICSQNCTKAEQFGSATGLKGSDGTIQICLGANAETFAMQHELIHAAQECGLPPNTPLYTNPADFKKKNGKDMTPDQLEQENAKCCAAEGEAADGGQCALMEQAGAFGQSGGSPKLSSSGIPFTRETCMEAFRNAACGPKGGNNGFEGCPVSRDYPDQFATDLQKLWASTSKAPSSCNDLIKNPDPRIANLKISIEHEEAVCTPGNQTTFPNTIGNTLCYVGLCAETSEELHRTIPGRIGATTQDQAYPNDANLGPEPADGNFLTAPPGGDTVLPPYEPRRLLAAMDADYCRILGLPPESPSALCTVTASRTLQLSLGDFLTETEQTYVNQQEAATTIQNQEAMAPALGIRIGTSLYTDYLRRFGKSYAELMQTMQRILTSMQNTNFPTEMCPLGTQQ